MEIPTGRGISKAKILKGKYEAKLEFPEGWWEPEAQRGGNRKHKEVGTTTEGAGDGVQCMGS